MGFFKNIGKRISRFLGFRKADKEKPVFSFKELELELERIADEQDKVREKLTSNIEDQRIDTLTENQEKLIRKRTETASKKKNEEYYQKLYQLNQEKELLETNLILQSKIKFEPEPIDEDLLIKLQAPLQEYELFTINPLESSIELREAAKTIREEDKLNIESIKNDVLGFSLKNIHIQREKARVEQERKEAERKLDEAYQNCLSTSNQHLENNLFNEASEALGKALDLKPHKEKKIKKLLRKITEEEEYYKIRKEKFDEKYEAAEKLFFKDLLEDAIEYYEDAKEFGINNYLCDRRIKETRDKIARIKRQEEERLRREQDEQERREKYKDDGDQIVNYLKENGIQQFYHYTDSRNINSIIQNYGLYSLNKLYEKGIKFEKGSETHEAPNYVRLSYSRNHPLMHVSISEGRIGIPKVFHIDMEVARLRNTRFSNVNAARTRSIPTVSFGDSLQWIKKEVKLDIIKQPDHFGLSLDEKPYYQAEVMVKDHIPLELILNI